MLSIDLNGTKIGDAVLESIGQNIPNLQNLQLVGTSITDQSLKVIAEFKHLRTLAISSCRRLSPEATRKLASCQNLEFLNIQDLNLANDDLLFLKQLENLSSLTVGSNSFDEAALKTIEFLALRWVNIDGMKHLDQQELQRVIDSINR